MNDKIEMAVKVLKKGGIVIFPTDTAYGIGCRIDDEKTIRRLFKLRKRPLNQATPVLVSSLEMAQEYLQKIPYDVKEKLIKPYWPGKLTLILSCNKSMVPKLVRGGGDNLGVRMPNSLLMLELISKAGVPILGPSANFHNDKTPFEFKDLDQNLVKLVDYVLEDKTNKKKEVSTVIDCTAKPWKIVRRGAVKLSI